MATTFSASFKRGCNVIYAMQIEGIPWLFVEKIPKRATATAEPANFTNYTDGKGGGTVAGLVLDGEKVAQEMDRKKGIGRARSVSFRLAYSPLEGQGIIDDLFQKPSLYSDITADIDSGASSFSATAVGGGWSAGGVYLGSEYIYAGGVSHSEPTTTFSSLTRGSWGDKYDHESGSFTASRQATDRPNVWRGRMVTIWECMVNPEGRSLFDQWLVGDYCRQIFKGTLDASPIPGSVGFEFTAQSLIRKLTQKMGFTSRWSVLHSSTTKHNSTAAQQAWHPSGKTGKTYLAPALYVPANTYKVHFNIKLSDGFDSDIVATTANNHVFSTLSGWAATIAADLVSESSSKLTGGASLNTSKAAHFLFDVADAGSGVKIKGESKAQVFSSTAPYFLESNQHSNASKTTDAQSASDAPANQFSLVPDWDWSGVDSKPWLVIYNDQAATFQDYTLPSSGYAVAEFDGVKELLKFEQGTTVGDNKAIFISGRGLNGGDTVNLAAIGVSLYLVTGAQGTLKEATLKLLESSGTGERGTYDTLGLGMGYGIDDEHIDEDSFSTGGDGESNLGSRFADRDVVAVGDSQGSLEDALGGWYTLGLSCIVERRSAGGTMRIASVKHEVYEAPPRDPSVVTITAADILIKGVTPVEVVESPNEVLVNTKSFTTGETPTVLVRSIPEMVREGVRNWDIKAPGFDREGAYFAAQDLIALGSGQYAMSLTLGPWVDLQVGDLCVLQMSSHRGTFDFDAGTVGTTSISARCVGLERDLVTLEQQARFLMYGHTLPASIYCPTATVTAHTGSNVTLDTSEAAWFVATETVRLFNPGREELGTPEVADVVINSIAGDVLTLASSAPAWVANGTTRATYPIYASASTTQRAFFFFSSAYRWK